MPIELKLELKVALLDQDLYDRRTAASCVLLDSHGVLISLRNEDLLVSPWVWESQTLRKPIENGGVSRSGGRKGK